MDDATQRNKPAHGPATLTDEDAEETARELEVLELIAAGFTDAEIEEILGLSEFAVKAHVKQLFGRLSGRNGARAVTLAASWRLLLG